MLSPLVLLLIFALVVVAGVAASIASVLLFNLMQMEREPRPSRADESILRSVTLFCTLFVATLCVLGFEMPNLKRALLLAFVVSVIKFTAVHAHDSAWDTFSKGRRRNESV